MFLLLVLLYMSRIHQFQEACMVRAFIHQLQKVPF
jgi:hypothetical protein